MKTDWIWVGLGSAIGGVCRYWAAALVGRWCGATFPSWTILGALPVGTLFVNVTGSMAIGFLAAWIEEPSRLLAHPDVARFLLPGLLGGYTTFSAFSLQTLELARGGQMGLAGLNVAGSVALCLLAVWLGHALGQIVAR